MKYGYSAADVRAAEQPLLDAGRGAELMHEAAAGLAQVCRRALLDDHGQITGRRVSVLAGAGNNGGDALFAAANLAFRGAAVTIVDALGKLHAAGEAAARAAGARIVDLADGGPATRSADLVIDGILGTGARPGFTGPAADFVRDWLSAAAEEQCVIAVDVPTGVDATTGQCSDIHVRADHTVTFGAGKAGLLLPGGADAAGEVTLVDIGLDMAPFRPAVEAPEESDIAADFPFPQWGDQKYSRGVLGLVAGSAQFPGAAALSAVAAVATGVGMLRLVAAAPVVHAVLAITPEVTAGRGRVQAWAMGPGDPDEDQMRQSIANAEENSLPLALDAGSLGLLDRPLRTAAVLTPHAGELETLLGRLTANTPDRTQIEADPVPHAVTAAQTLNSVVLLKGPRTVIARPDGTIVAPPPGPAALATAGTGDVLLGILGALLATTVNRGADPARVAGLAVQLHSAAGTHTTHASGLPMALERHIVAMRGDA